MYINQLLNEALQQLSKYPLNHLQGKLIPVGECIPDCDDLTTRPNTLFRFQTMQVDLQWTTISRSFNIRLTDLDSDVQAIVDGLVSTIQKLQKEIDTAIQCGSELVTMLPWLQKRYKEGFGDYNTYRGGYGSFVDPRTNNRYGLFINTTGIYVMFELNFTFSIVNI